MTDEIMIDLHSPERGWEPFVEWLMGEGVNPARTSMIRINPDTMVMIVELQRRSADGGYIVDDGEVATKRTTVTIDSLPPRRQVG